MSILRIFVACAALTATGFAAAQAPAPETVYTRARLTSTFEESGGKFYVRLRLLPRSKIPFTTQVFRVRDRAMVSGIEQGAWVKFTTERVDGENTLTSIHVVDECKRFQQCD